MRKFTLWNIAAITILPFLFLVPANYSTTVLKAALHGQSFTGHQSASARRIVGRMLSKHTVDMSTVPGTSFSPASTAIDQSVRPQKVTIAAGVAPIDRHPHSPSQNSRSANIKATPPLTTNFSGMYENYCQGNCPPPDPSPDMALGASANWVLQGVNRWFAVYTPTGVLQPHWPKTFQNFFGVPFPNGCTAIPNLFNPRAFYDPNDQRFWAAVLNSVVPHGTCTSTYSKVWIAVSQTNNPTGRWNIYSFDLMLGSQNFGDFTQFGFDQHAVYISADMWTQPNGTGTFEYENTLGFNKAAMEAGQNVTPYGYSSFVSGGVQINGVQPVEVEAYTGKGPDAGIFISSFDYNFGGGYCKQGCSGLIVWAIANPATPQESLSSILVPSSNYVKAPNGDQPGCNQCLGTLDPAINSTPIWRNGQITFNLTTAVNNGTQVVAGIFWGQISVILDSNGVLTGASFYQSGYFSFSGDTSALCSAMMNDLNGNLVMVFTETSSSIYPGAYYAVQPAGSPPGTFPDGGLAMAQGQATTSQSRWADYSATSINGVGAQGMWIASEYEAADQTWATSIGKVIAN